MTDETIIALRGAVKYFELAAAVTGIGYWSKWKNSPVKYFIIYLAVIAAAEFTGNMMGNANLSVLKNYWYKLFVLPFEFLFLAFFFWKHVVSGPGKNLIPVMALIYAGSFIIEGLFLDYPTLPFSSFSYSIANILLLLMIIMYYKRLVNSEKLIFFYKEPFFWIVTGLLIFYLGSFPYYLLFNMLVNKFYEEIYLPFQVIVICLNYIMYAIFIFTFIWTKPR